MNQEFIDKYLDTKLKNLEAYKCLLGNLELNLHKGIIREAATEHMDVTVDYYPMIPDSSIDIKNICTGKHIRIIYDVCYGYINTVINLCDDDDDDCSELTYREIIRTSSVKRAQSFSPFGEGQSISPNGEGQSILSQESNFGFQGGQ